ncbi:hypothetical protein EG68_12389 [Paragonimus skrjabini miyazakii]|uniref:Uncharacterized protein n=1 Tax=Paragonimus skrjabini miyazakii TaxID=59628 RepID=A0A8S9YK13_9TREM|nr:hypothetical protein EG68_12389 [Paragonimus skrjabini miyazakii]
MTSALVAFILLVVRRGYCRNRCFIPVSRSSASSNLLVTYQRFE